MSAYASEVAALSKQCSDSAANYGVALCEDFRKSVILLQEWVAYLEQTKLTGTGDFFIEGVTSSIRECAGLLALGLVRPALFSMRAEMDIVFSWLYFKDHPVELGLVQATGEGFKLKREIIFYLDTLPGYKERFSLLLACRKRTVEDPYRLLSAHVHSQSSLAVPQVEHFSDLVVDHSKCLECVEIQSSCSEYLSDVFLSLFAYEWTALPLAIRGQLERLTEKQKKAFFG